MPGAESPACSVKVRPHVWGERKWKVVIIKVEDTRQQKTLTGWDRLASESINRSLSIVRKLGDLEGILWSLQA